LPAAYALAYSKNSQITDKKVLRHWVLALLTDIMLAGKKLDSDKRTSLFGFSVSDEEEREVLKSRHYIFCFVSERKGSSFTLKSHLHGRSLLQKRRHDYMYNDNS
jgi:hypothetical protein